MKILDLRRRSLISTRYGDMPECDLLLVKETMHLLAGLDWDGEFASGVHYAQTHNS